MRILTLLPQLLIAKQRTWDFRHDYAVCFREIEKSVF